jgi:sodium-coupled neutral amino acid transporter 11
MILVRGSIKAEATSMQSLVRFCFGKYGTMALNAFLLILAWGFLATYTVIIGDEVPSLLESIIGQPSTKFMEWMMRRRAVVMLASFCVFLPVSMSRSLAGLAKYSGIALAGIVFIIGCVVSVAPSVEPTFKGTSPISIVEVAGIPSAIGVIAFAYVCQHNVLLNYNSMKDATPRRFRNVAGVSIGVTVVLTLICGCAEIVFREKTRPIILESFSKDDVLINICRLLFAVDVKNIRFFFISQDKLLKIHYPIHFLDALHISVAAFCL